ncbi:hypothetical protein G4Z16_21800 [Streptomyces bathyalis]|uniref:Uncharacterized protein n=1 Tax=Streptomyces bathyalis TaxID=2710756 RepID=A0A7T1T910_9ACTN|nr:hypothetical protein [Streptomyces bathyalis]QPP08598.1 hypothetical protein G4Z16_21800 [Streptomyces bathyalis]
MDSSGGRRRTWRRLGLAMGAIGGGYALVVAVTVIGGHSEAPWGVLIPGADDRAARVVPERGESQTKAPWADGARLGEPGAYASPTDNPSDPNSARSPVTSPEASPADRAAAGTGVKAKTARSGTFADSGGTSKGNTGGSAPGSGSAGGTGGSTGGAVPTEPSTEPTEGGTTGSPTPTADPSGSPDSQSEGGLSGLLGGILGGPSSTVAAGAE